MENEFANLLDVAGNASGTIKNAVSAFADFRKLAKEGKLPPDAADKILDLSAELSEAQLNLAHVESEILRLQRHQEARDEIKRRKRNYQLWEYPTGSRVYRLRDDAGTGEMPHEVCPDCFERDQIIVLQGGGAFLHCTRCKASYKVKEISPITVGSRRRRR